MHDPHKLAEFCTRLHEIDFTIFNEFYFSFITSKTSDPITLKKNYRYYIEAVLLGNAVTDWIGLGATFPDGKIHRPISKTYLRRSMCEYYQQC